MVVLLWAGADPQVSWEDYTPLQLVSQRKQPPAKLLCLQGMPAACSSEGMWQVVAQLVPGTGRLEK